MATTHPIAFRNTVADLVDSTLSTAGELVFRLTGTADSPGTAAATLTFGNPAFGAASSGIITANAITSDTNATGNASPSVPAPHNRPSPSASIGAGCGAVLAAVDGRVECAQRLAGQWFLDHFGRGS